MRPSRLTGDPTFATASLRLTCLLYIPSLVSKNLLCLSRRDFEQATGRTHAGMQTPFYRFVGGERFYTIAVLCEPTLSVAA